MRGTHQNSQQASYKQLVLPGTPEKPVPLTVIMLDRITHTIDKPECSVKSCICHEAEKIRLLDLQNGIVDSTAVVVK